MLLCVELSKSLFHQFYLKYLLAADLDAAVAGLWLLRRELLPQDFQLLHQVSLVFGHRQALRLLRQLGGGEGLRRDPGNNLLLQRRRLTGGIM